MTRIIKGDRIGKQGTIRLGCSAVLFNPARDEVLLTRRADNGEWCLPGGGVEPGESAAEGCEREFFEETGLRVRVLRLTGIYSDPDQLVIYPDDTRIQIVALNFEVEAVGGQPGVSGETTEVRFIPLAEVDNMELFHGHNQRIHDVLAGREAAFIR
jgi:8-oxo-dGTP pyrophosphatase MutT (NUDIX family)